eukprot:4305883-Pyramimonas_sp.AAC.1
MPFLRVQDESAGCPVALKSSSGRCGARGPSGRACPEMGSVDDEALAPCMLMSSPATPRCMPRACHKPLQLQGEVDVHHPLLIHALRGFAPTCQSLVKWCWSVP